MNLKGVNLKKERTKIQMVLTVLVILSVVRQFFLGNYHNMFLGILTLFLFMVPAVLDQTLGVTIPAGLETVILIFIFSAEILGEINAFYVKIPVWDTILHTTNGFLMAAIGFALIDLFNRSDRFSIKMSPYFVAFFAFCFSMTVGVLWEFFEFSMDWFFGLDMQKDDRCKCSGACGHSVGGDQWRKMESGWISGYRNRGYDERSDGEFYRSGGVLDHRNSISEAPRQRKTCGITDSAGKRREGAEAIKRTG